MKKTKNHKSVTQGTFVPPLSTNTFWLFAHGICTYVLLIRSYIYLFVNMLIKLYFSLLHIIVIICSSYYSETRYEYVFEIYIEYRNSDAEYSLVTKQPMCRFATAIEMFVNIILLLYSLSIRFNYFQQHMAIIFAGLLVLIIESSKYLYYNGMKHNHRPADGLGVVQRLPRPCDIFHHTIFLFISLFHTLSFIVLTIRNVEFCEPLTHRFTCKSIFQCFIDTGYRQTVHKRWSVVYRLPRSRSWLLPLLILFIKFTPSSSLITGIMIRHVVITDLTSKRVRGITTFQYETTVSTLYVNFTEVKTFTII